MMCYFHRVKLLYAGYCFIQRIIIDFIRLTGSKEDTLSLYLKLLSQSQGWTICVQIMQIKYSL